MNINHENFQQMHLVQSNHCAERNQRCSFWFQNISFKAIIQNIPQGYSVFEIILKGEQKQYLVIFHKSTI